MTDDNRGRPILWLWLTGSVFLLSYIVASNSESRQDHFDAGLPGAAARVEFAFMWTLKAVGVVIVVISLVQLVHVTGRPDQAELVVPTAIALLGGLLLTGAHWSLGVVFGVVVLGWLWLRTCRKSGAAPSPSAHSNATQSPPI